MWDAAEASGKLEALYKTAEATIQNSPNLGVWELNDVQSNLISMKFEIEQNYTTIPDRDRYEMLYTLALANMKVANRYRDIDAVNMEEYSRRKATEYLNQIAPDRHDARDLMLIVSYSERGNMYIRSGDTESAISMYDKAVNSGEETLLLYGDRQECQHKRNQLIRTLAVALNNLGMEYYHLGKHEQSLTYCRRALFLLKDIEAESSIEQQIKINIADIETSRHEA